MCRCAYSWSARFPGQLRRVNNPVLFLPLPKFLQGRTCVDAWQRESTTSCKPPARQHHGHCCWTQKFFAPLWTIWKNCELACLHRENSHIWLTFKVTLLKSFTVYTERLLITMLHISGFFLINHFQIEVFSPWREFLSASQILPHVPSESV